MAWRITPVQAVSAHTNPCHGFYQTRSWGIERQDLYDHGADWLVDLKLRSLTMFYSTATMLNIHCSSFLQWLQLGWPPHPKDKYYHSSPEVKANRYHLLHRPHSCHNAERTQWMTRVSLQMTTRRRRAGVRDGRRLNKKAGCASE